MKKVFALALAAILTMGVLTGCGGSNGGSGSGSADGSSTSSAAQTKLEKIQASGKLVYVTSPDYAPYEFVDLSKLGQGDEQYVGADIELARYIADQLGVKLEIQAMDYDAVLTSVGEGKCDIAISGIVANEDRKIKMDFTNTYKPYEEGGQTLIIRKEDADKFKSLEDFNNADVTLGVQNGSLQQTLANQQLPNAKQSPIGKLTDGVLQLSKGKIDALVISRITGEGFCVSYPDLSMSGVFFVTNEDSVAIAVPKGNEEFVEKLNEIVADVVEQGLYTKWEAEAQAMADAQQKEAIGSK